jgi:hypothetical protein
VPELIQEKPVALALIVCDEIINDAETQKKTLVGIFNKIGFQALPAVVPKLVVYVSVHGGKGNYSAKLRITNEEKRQLIVELGGSIAFSNPMQVVEIAYRLINLPLPLEGLYSIEFLCNDELVFSRNFLLERVQINPPKA